MNLFTPKHDESNPLSKIQTQFSKFLRIPKPEIPNLFSIFNNQQKNSNNLALSDAEINGRLAGTYVYTISNDPGQCFSVSSDSSERGVEFYFFSRTDAEDLLAKVDCSTQFQLRGVPLTQVVDYEKRRGPIRLVPEVSQVSNALKEKKENADLSDDTFSGVPIFQSEDLILHLSKNPNKCRPAFFRKDDLEKTLANAKGPNYKEGEIIQVAAFEDIIQEMKDPSTSKSNDIYFVAPGRTTFGEDLL